MLRTISQPRANTQTARLVGIASFTLLTALAARASVEIGGPVPFTFQVLVVLLAGLVLGARDGALSQAAYVGLIALNMPIDARGWGTAALFGPTAGYLFSFIAAAWVTGMLAEGGQTRWWQRWRAGVVGIIVIYVYGTLWLKVYFDNVRSGMSWEAAWKAGVQPFIGYDLLKAGIAAALTESGHLLVKRLTPQ